MECLNCNETTSRLFTLVGFAWKSNHTRLPGLYCKTQSRQIIFWSTRRKWPVVDRVSLKSTRPTELMLQPTVGLESSIPPSLDSSREALTLSIVQDTSTAPYAMPVPLNHTTSPSRSQEKANCSSHQCHIPPLEFTRRREREMQMDTWIKSRKT